MDRTQFRSAQRKRISEEQKKIKKRLGLPKGFFQFAARHGVMPGVIEADRLKFSKA